MPPGNHGGKRTGAGRPKGTRNHSSVVQRREVVAGLKGANLSIREFWALVASQAIAGEGWAATIIANRLCPPLKPTDEKIKLPQLGQGTGTERALVVIDAISDGLISPIAGAALLDALSKVLSIEEQAELKQRIEKLEQRKKT